MSTSKKSVNNDSKKEFTFNENIKISLVNSLNKFFDVVVKVTNDMTSDNTDPIWFRGQREIRWALESSFHRKHKKISNLELLLSKNITNFQLESRHRIFQIQPAPNMVPDYDSKYQWLSIMQHLGSATCLLDWCEKATTALFFAVGNYLDETDKENVKLSTPCVWLLNPKKLNKKIGYQWKNYNEIPTVLDIDKKYSKGRFIRKPLAFTSIKSTNRIDAQSGAFVAMPLTTKTALNLYDGADEFLQIIALFDCKEIANSFKSIGFEMKDFYPDLVDSGRTMSVSEC